MHILVATDLSARSDRAIARGALLARQHRARLTVATVVDSDIPADLHAHAVEWSKGALARHVGSGSGSGVEAALAVLEGKPAERIAHFAAAGSVDLIVLGVGRRSKRLARGTALSVVRSTLHPVLITLNSAERSYCSIVVGTDLSARARAAIRQAFAFAPGGTYHLVHAYHRPFPGYLSGDASVNEFAYAERQQLDSFLESEMDELDRRGQELGVRAEHLHSCLREGDAVDVLRAECARVSADLLVVASSPSTRLTRAFHDSVAERLLAEPPTDVLVARPF